MKTKWFSRVNLRESIIKVFGKFQLICNLCFVLAECKLIICTN